MESLNGGVAAGRSAPEGPKMRRRRAHLPAPVSRRFRDCEKASFYAGLPGCGGIEPVTKLARTGEWRSAFGPAATDRDVSMAISDNANPHHLSTPSDAS